MLCRVVKIACLSNITSLHHLHLHKQHTPWWNLIN